jgi:HK97 family phage portal protein
MKQYLEDYYNLQKELHKKRLEEIKIKNEILNNNNISSNNFNFTSNSSINPQYPIIQNYDVKNYYASWVSACVDVRAYSVASAKQVMYVKKNQTERDEPDEHEFIDLLESPNPIMSKHELYETIVQSLDLYGNAYIWILKGKRFKKPREIWIIPPYEMQIAIDDNGLPVGYKRNLYPYNMNVTKEENLPLEDIIHIKYPAPNNSYYGMSIIQKAAYAIGIDLYQNQYQYDLLRNGANIQGYVELTDNIKSGEDRTRRETQFKQKYTGAESQKFILGDKFIPTQLPPRELDWVKSKPLSKEEILAQFQVPSAMVGAVERITYANSDATIAGFLNNTIKPLCAKIDSKFNMYIKRMYGKNYYLKSELDIPEDPLIAFRDNSLGLASGSLSRNEYRRSIGYDKIKDPEFDKPIPIANINSGTLPSSDASHNTGANATNDNTSQDNTDVNVPKE